MKKNKFPDLLNTIVILIIANVISFFLIKLQYYTLEPFLMARFGIIRNNNYILLLILFVEMITYFIIIYFLIKRSVIKLGDIIKIDLIDYQHFLILILILIGSIIIGSRLNNLIQFFIPMPKNIDSLYQGNIILIIFVRISIFGILYEIIFRGLILRGLLNNYSYLYSITVLSLIIAITPVLEGFPNQTVYFNVIPNILGCMTLSIVYVITRNLLSTMIIASISNVYIVFLKEIFGELRGYTTIARTLDYQPFWVDLIGLFLFVTGIVLLYFYTIKKKNEWEKIEEPVENIVYAEN